MCGIIGIITRDESLNIPQLIKNMANTMINRGPDGYGEYIEKNVGLAMRRLSIIDLDKGWQPFISPDRDVILFQNGEIYNYRLLKKELLKEGIKFSTDSDTEVLLYGYLKWGLKNLLSRIDGMFSISIYDKRENKIFLIRDFFGEKPLYYVHLNNLFAFGSNIHSLTLIPPLELELNPICLATYFLLHYIPGQNSIFKNILKILPGEILEYNLSSHSIKTFKYYLPNLIFNKKSHDTNLELSIFSSVKKRLISDKPVGIFLSGGLDSSLIAAMASKIMPGIETFSIGFPDELLDERIHSSLVAQHIGSNHHHYLFDVNKFNELIPLVIKGLDEPLGDQALLPLFWIAKEAKKYVSVVLSGEGADEIFGGYDYYYNNDTISNLNVSKILGKFSRKFKEQKSTFLNLQNNVTSSGFPFIITYEELNRLFAFHELKHLCGNLEIVKIFDNPVLQKQYSDLITWLPDDLLIKFDRMTMIHSLEGRTPYLNRKVVEYGFREYSTALHPSRFYKNELRNVAKNWIPNEIIERKKAGFVLPMEKWITDYFDDHGGFSNYVNDYKIPYIDSQFLIHLFNQEYSRGSIRVRFYFAYIILTQWYYHITSSTNPSAQMAMK